MVKEVFPLRKKEEWSLLQKIGFALCILLLIIFGIVYYIKVHNAESSSDVIIEHPVKVTYNETVVPDKYETVPAPEKNLHVPNPGSGAQNKV